LAGALEREHSFAKRVGLSVAAAITTRPILTDCATGNIERIGPIQLSLAPSRIHARIELRSQIDSFFLRCGTGGSYAEDGLMVAGMDRIDCRSTADTSAARRLPWARRRTVLHRSHLRLGYICSPTLMVDRLRRRIENPGFLRAGFVTVL